MLLNERNRKLIKKMVKECGLNEKTTCEIKPLDCAAEKCGLNEKTTCKIKPLDYAAKELGFTELKFTNFWKNHITVNKLTILSSEISEEVVALVKCAATLKKLDEATIKRIERRMKGLDCGLERANKQQLLRIYEYLPLIKTLSEEPRIFLVWGFYRKLKEKSEECKKKLEDKILSIQNCDDQDENRLEKLKETFIYDCELEKKEKKEKKEKADILKCIVRETEKIIEENPFVLFVMNVFPDLPNSEKSFLLLIRFLSRQSENLKEILKCILKIMEELNPENDADFTEYLCNQEKFFNNVLAEIKEPNYIPTPELYFKKDIDVKSLTEPSIEDLEEDEQEELERFFENDDMLNYLREIKAHEAVESYSDYDDVHDYYDHVYDYEDIKENAEYFIELSSNDCYLRIIVESHVSAINFNGNVSGDDKN